MPRDSPVPPESFEEILAWLNPDREVAATMYVQLRHDLAKIFTFRGCADPRGALQGKTRFCNFIYTTKIPFRERFYSELSHYKEVSAPGKSMNNCNDLASRYSADWQS